MRLAKSFLIKLSAVIAILIIIGAVFYFYFPKIWGDLLYPLEYEEHIVKYARQYDVEPSLIAAMIYSESHFNPEAVSRMGARGLMQIMPATATGIAQRIGDTKVGDLFDPETNIRYGTYYIAEKIDYYDGDLTAALAAYNGGDAAGQRYVISRSTSGLAKETQGYIRTINTAQNNYEKLYGNILDAKNVAEMLRIKENEREKTWVAKIIDLFKGK